MFLSDFDGTLLRSDGTISERTKRAIARYRAAGGIFAVCTGRGLISILPRMEEIGIRSGVVVSFQGAVISDIATGELYRVYAYPLSDALEVINFFERENAHVHIYTIDRLYANMRDEMLEGYEAVCGVRADVINEPLFRFAEREKLKIIKILAMTDPDGHDALLEKAQRALGDQYYVTCSSDWLVEVMPKGQDKGAAVRFLSEWFSVPREEIAAAGDQMNDLPMLEEAGGKFIVRSCSRSLKQTLSGAAKELPSNDEDGVAAALEQILGDEI